MLTIVIVGLLMDVFDKTPKIKTTNPSFLEPSQIPLLRV